MNPPTLKPSQLYPRVHGVDIDPRYPSPRELRVYLAFMIDLVVHMGIAVAIAIALASVTDTPSDATDIAITAMVFVFPFVSIVDRIFVQYAFQATVGKAFTGLRVIRDDNGERGTLEMFTMNWLRPLLYGILYVVTLGLAAFFLS